MTGFTLLHIIYIKSNRPEKAMTAIFEPRKQPQFKNKEQNVQLSRGSGAYHG